MTWVGCAKAPPGWACTRHAGHDGPCAAKVLEPHERALRLVMRLDAPFDTITGTGFQCPDCQGNVAHEPGCEWAAIVEAMNKRPSESV